MDVSATVSQGAPDVSPGISGERSLAQYAYDVLQDRLIMLDIPPGAPINDEAIGKELGIGRTPVREALKRLEIDHLVTVHSRRGTFAANVDIRELAGVSEIRERLEPLAAGRAARFASTSARDALRALAAEIERFGDGDHDLRAVMRHDIKAHRAIYRAAASRHLEDVLVRFGNLATRVWCVLLDRLPTTRDHVLEHVQLLHSIAEGNVELAESTAREHVVEFERMVRGVL